MLKTIRTHKRSILGLTFAGLISASMLFFGNSFGGHERGSGKYALKVGDQEVSYSDFAERRRGLENRFRSMLGENYYQAIESMGINIQQQTIDQTINEMLLEQEANAQGLVAGDSEIQQTIVKDVFQGQRFSAAMYSAMLRQMGVTSTAFEAGLRRDAVRRQLADFILDTSRASMREAKADLARDKTEYSLSYAEFSVNDVEAKLQAPSEEILKQYYEDHAADFETAERVSYEFAVFTPATAKDKVQVSPEDVEFYYSEHLSDYSTPEQLKASRIVINFPKNADPAELAKTKTRAEEAHGKAIAGEPFDKLVELYSDDIAAKATKGSIGTVTRGKMSKEFDTAAFGLAGPGIADLLATDSGYEIIKVEEYSPAKAKELKSVENQIIEALKNQEAPAYARAMAEEAQTELQRDKKTLSEVVVSRGSLAQSSPGFVETSQDPPGSGLRGLTARVFSDAGPIAGASAVIDLGDLSVLAVVKDFKERTIPQFDEARDRVLATWKAAEAQKVARANAEKFLESLKASSSPTLAAVAKTEKIAVQEVKAATRAAGLAPLTSEAIKRAAFAVQKAPALLPEVYTSDKGFIVAQVTAVVEPKAEANEQGLLAARDKASRELMQLAHRSLIEKLKSDSKIDIDPGLLAE